MHHPNVDSPGTMAGRAEGGGGRRLRVAALVAPALWGLYLLHAGLQHRLDALTVGAAAVVAVGSAAIIWLTSSSASVDTVRGYGSLYLLGTTLAVALVEQNMGMAGGLGAGISWTAIWVVFFPLAVPCAPNKTLLKALIAASMTPVAFGIFVALGRPVPAVPDLIALFVPVYVGAFLAYGAARVMARLGGRMAKMASIGRYALVRKLGEGGMGDVWEAQHRLLARPVALKLVKLDGGEPSTALARFAREARVTASLESAHTIELYDFGATEDGRLFYAMELLEGMDLEQLIKKHGKLPKERVVHILRQALHSLEEAHARGLVHRDVKPANLHIGRYALSHDHVKVLDFGLVKSSVGVDLGLTLTGEGRISGTPAYMAPEAINGQAIDGRADIYALGCVAIYLLTGERVFPEANDVLASAVAHVTTEPASLSARGVQIGADLERVLMSCLEKDPVRRPDAASLREMLDQCEVEPWTEAKAAEWWTEYAPLPPASRISEHPMTIVTRPDRPMLAGVAS